MGMGIRAHAVSRNLPEFLGRTTCRGGTQESQRHYQPRSKERDHGRKAFCVEVRQHG
jgi:hypothetical protein